MLEQIGAFLGDLVGESWVSDMTLRGEHVALFRQYEEGDHRAKLTDTMKEMLRISGTALDQFNANYCEMVVAAMADRLNVISIDGARDDETRWSAEVLRRNRFDGLQMDAHQAAIRDGATYIMIEPQDDGMPVLAHEPAWDGDSGLIPIYDRAQRDLLAAAKVWHEGSARRVNMYWPDEINKYRADGAEGQLQLIDQIKWVGGDGEALGVPLVPLVNRLRTRNPYGISEISKIIPLQDVLNRALYSLVATGELTAFQIRYLIGAKLENRKVTPGMFLEIGGDGIDSAQRVEVGVLPQGEIGQMINLATFAIDQICTVSRTPLLTGALGGDKSGETLKMLETGLLGKIRGFHTKAGNSWEDVMSLAARLQAEFGTAATPVNATWSCRWQPAELRNDTEVTKNAKEVADRVSARQFLRMIAPVWGWSNDQIDAIIEERDEERLVSLASLGSSLPGFDQFAP
ncbi:MAG: phage portal protein [Anaerolineae bacterium]|nr:phage portal protein [Anaerolineae bacterium]NUQ06365.1 phage portal protein [Anaerolineae bacterium]